MDPFLVEKESASYQNLYRLLKYYLALYSASILVSLIGIIVFSVLSSEIGSHCQTTTGMQVSITQTISYVFALLFSIACMHLIGNASSLIYVHITFWITLISKIVALIFSIIYRNRNWGECYLSNSQGIMLITDISLEILIIIALYFFSFKMFRKMEEKSLLQKIPIVSILKA